MTREEVIRLAKEAGIIARGLPVGGVKALEAFVVLVAEKEREECVKELKSERDALKADAERYRWLRDRAWPFEFKGNSPEDADAAIDAARGET